MAGGVTARQVDYVVVGAGLLGLSAGWALTRRGREVTVLEQVSPGHPGAGSKGSCRIFRLGYEDPAYVRAARQARALWHSLEDNCSRKILYPTPHLSIGPGLEGVHAAMAAAGAPTELLTAAEVAARFPGLRVEGPALLEPESAVTAADVAMQALAAAVPDIRSGVRVTGLADDGRRVTVHTSDGALSARSVIVCAGPESAGLLDWPVPTAPTLEQVAYLTPIARDGLGHDGRAAGGGAGGTDGAAGGDGSGMPIFIGHGHGAAGQPYGLPVPGSSRYKAGLHHSGPAVRPGDYDQAADPGLTARFEELARRYLPGFEPRPVDVERCVYDNTPDEDFIVDRIGNVVVGCGTSGHGFKFGPLLGEWLTTLATGEAPDGPNGLDELGPRLRLARFTPRPA